MHSVGEGEGFQLGVLDGFLVGLGDGIDDGVVVGETVGVPLGCEDGSIENDGAIVGIAVGLTVGEDVGGGTTCLPPPQLQQASYTVLPLFTTPESPTLLQNSGGSASI
mmetsp:Transcript_4524/g.5193  ORF Transcript_4524/g.5193 Transcript_4524/m.5193 type:complete len:108 (+) Transcript_4524:278-601(+)